MTGRVPSWDRADSGPEVSGERKKERKMVVSSQGRLGWGAVWLRLCYTAIASVNTGP